MTFEQFQQHARRVPEYAVNTIFTMYMLVVFCALYSTHDGKVSMTFLVGIMLFWVGYIIRWLIVLVLRLIGLAGRLK